MLFSINPEQPSARFKPRRFEKSLVLFVMGETAHISNVLTKWALKDMSFRPGAQDQVDVTTSINLGGICLGPLVDVWTYVEKHVKSETTVQKIKGNLKLHAQAELKQDGKNSELLKERDRLRQEVAELEKSTRILDESVKEVTATIQEQEKKLYLMTLANQDHKRTTLLLNKNRNQIHDKAKDLNRKIKELGNCLQSLIPPSEKESSLDKFKIDIEKMCALMQKSLNELVNEDPNMDAIHGSKLEIGKNLATVLDNLPHPTFLRLVQEQQESETALKKALESAAPYPRTDEKLNFNPVDVQPLQKLLYDLSWFHTQSSSRAFKAKNSILVLKREMASLKSELDDQLSVIFPSDDKNKAAARHLIDLEIQVSSRKSAVDSMRHSLDDLENFCSRSEANQVEIERKIATIESNSYVADHFSLLICTLARKHANNARLLQQSVTRLQRLATDELRTVQSLLHDHVRNSQANVGKEWELFKQLKPSQVLSVPVERKLIPVGRLAIHRFLPVAADECNVAVEHLDSTLKYLGLHRFIPVLDVFQSVGHMKGQNGRLERAIRWHEFRQQEIADKYGLSWLQHGSAHFQELAKELNEKRQKQEADTLPSLESRLRNMDDVNQAFVDIQVALTEWSDEPAKLIDTGRLVSGESLEHYRKQWSKSLTMCRKKS